MGQVINTNILSLTAQRNLQSSQGELATSLQRLSSGLRINSAKDDAAGLAISERFTTQIRGLNQAIRNANDGISLAQTGEAALATVTQNLQRIRELAVQSVNATNSDTDRATLQQEVSQRLNEIDRIAGQTSFNGRNVLDGSFGSALFQVGANVGETIGLDLESSVRTTDVGQVATATSVDLNTVIFEGSTAGRYAIADLSSLVGADLSVVGTGGRTAQIFLDTTNDNKLSANLDFTSENAVLTIAGVDVTLNKDYSGASSFGTVADDIRQFLTDAGRNIGYSGSLSTGWSFGANDSGLPLDITNANQAAIDAGIVNSAGKASANTTSVGFQVDGNSVTLSGNAAANATLQDIVDDIQGDLDANANGIYSVSAEGNGIVIAKTATGVASTAPVISNTWGNQSALFSGGTSTDGDGTGVAASTLDLSDLTIQFGSADPVTIIESAKSFDSQQDFVDALNTAMGSNGTATLGEGENGEAIVSIAGGEAITIGGADAETAFSAASFALEGDLSQTSVTSVENANAAINKVDVALTAVSDLRSTFGAIQNRFESTIANLSTTTENLQASRSRILDADFAQETANLTRAQILQQAGISVLAQANVQPQSVLALLN